MDLMSFIVGICFGLVILFAFSMLGKKDKQGMKDLYARWDRANELSFERNTHLGNIAEHLMRGVSK